jgi:purine-binding chemotaxis protein CheW
VDQLSEHVFVQLRVGAESYALPVEAVIEVSMLEASTPLPGGPRELLGLQNLRGHALPVYDLGAYLGAGATPKAERMIVVSDGRRRAGFAVDAVTGVGPLPERTASDTALLSGSALEGDRLVGVLAVDRLFARLEGASAE